MFDGMPEQLHQFITPTTTTRTTTTSCTTTPLIHHHLPFPPNNNNTFTPFDPYNNNNPSNSHHHHHHHQFQPNLLHPIPLHHHQKHGDNMEMNQRQQLPELVDPWTNNEVLALLRIRSSMESWFPELTWEHVSRKLAELGYKRSADKCKEKFEEESRYFTHINNNNNNYGGGTTANAAKGCSYRGSGFLSELEELYDHHNQVESTEKPPLSDEGGQENKTIIMEQEQEEEEGPGTKQEETTIRKRKRERANGGGGGRFEMFKGFCESIVHTMMEQQEEMHNKLISDMARRDQEKLAREEAWKKIEMERMNNELEMMAKEQAVAGDRQANIIEFLKNFSPEIQSLIGGGGIEKNGNSTLNPNSSSSTVIPNSGDVASSLNINPSLSPSPQDTLQDAATTTITTTPPAGNNPSSSPVNKIETNSVANKANSSRVHAVEKDDTGRRWPKDEVLALINLRCQSQNNNNEDNNNKAPLWERISQGMNELGYKRSSKRCKEKWENINKYFRKTKDNVNKKRSIDSRTCPYFHQLSNLYSQGKLVLQTHPHHDHDIRQENDQTTTQFGEPDDSQVGFGGGNDNNGGGSSDVQAGGGDNHDGGEKTLMQVPSLDFDQF